MKIDAARRVADKSGFLAPDEKRVHSPRAMKPTSSRLFVFAVLAGLASCQGCLGCNTSPINNEELLLPRSCESAPPLIDPPRLDILFVIDNSNSMREEQEAVARELTGFIDELKKGGGVPSDFNVGVVTTSVYLNGNVGGQRFLRYYPAESGRLRPVPVSLPDGGLDMNDFTSDRILSGNDDQLLEKFAKLVRQGVDGSGQETPFEAVRLALVDPAIADAPLEVGGNKGFLRDGARLLIVVLTDEDDCSEETRPPSVAVGDDPSTADCTVHEMELKSVGEYQRLFTENLKNLDDTRKEIIWTAIAPVGIETKAAMSVLDGAQVRNIDCPTSNQGGFRQRQMAELFDPTLANLDSICKSSYQQTLINIAQLASVSQSLELKDVADEKLMQFVITRKDGSRETCTLSNEGIIDFKRLADGTTSRFQFGNQCRRRFDDQSVTVKMICAT